MGIQEIWRDGELIETIEIPDDENTNENTESEITISPLAIDKLKTTLEDPATNSIAKVKTALIEFFTDLGSET